MKLYNALSQRVETFEPQGDAVTIYVCGITPYDTTHLGHIFTYASFDNLIRYLESSGRPVRYVQNVTDIDDDILRKARQAGDNWRDLGNRWTVHFIEDNLALNVRPPDFYPRATEVIEEIIAAVQQLLAAGVAYQVAGNVYFHVASDPGYGQLSRLSYAEMLPIANERGNNPDDPHKRDPLDFVLWQAHVPGEPAWHSPWGSGRPGWHIECSTMSTKYLGQTIDIHGGGADLLFPHHESEIAQAEQATRVKPFTHFWLHTAMVRHEGEKMSKSLGNLVMVRDLLRDGWSPDALRLYLATHHYRDAWSHSPEELSQAAGMAQRWLEAITAGSGDGSALDSEPAAAAFRTLMDDDLNTPAAVTALDQLANDILAAGRARQDVRQAQETLRRHAGLLGLRLDAGGPEERVVAGWQQHKERFVS
ncbi:MAG: cysteine--tRNA ligase [Chloroflexi bacterium]|nr:cysteine--tRNA ligase [Chloroflexota bacterium]MCI0574850.1 cysteine--tRNA ligase [Chloroflexota bacterium]MCI0645932.1 cysteine--tRNA ligase [Chloroflexota bacterium]MCI0726899.1 cysteine--tRNA ligase [Chloroflexota bacterium]